MQWCNATHFSFAKSKSNVVAVKKEIREMHDKYIYKRHHHLHKVFLSDLCIVVSAVSEGLAALAFTGVEVNMVLFSKSVLRQTNADAAKTFSTWMGTLNICTLLGAFLSDSYLGRYLTCVVFQAVLVIVSPLSLKRISKLASFFTSNFNFNFLKNCLLILSCITWTGISGTVSVNSRIHA